ncbi:glycosyltransferase [Curtobacterium ammoniigenes]|uniref:glycosyltransferase n=1 Tax=Curtobacterium ammoniigenes TaxID=395387 RepID=UPI00082ACA52|nr:glycosyltransferase [Curtobacterium ammoniigenes]
MNSRRLVRSVRRLPRRTLNGLRAEWYAMGRRRPVDQNLVLFESFAGNGATCNPEALFRAMLAAPDLKDRTAVWALDRASARSMQAEFRGNTRVRVVERGTFAYWTVLATAGVLINNATFPPEFDRRPEQRYLNTWHGTPLKRMGFDEPDGGFASANTIRNFLQATHLLSQNRYMTDRMYRQAYKLDGFGPARLIETGYPRNDHLFDTPGAEATRSRLGVRSLQDGGGVVLYAPTWRGERFTAPTDHTGEIARVAAFIQATLEQAGSAARVLVKPHQAVLELARQQPALHDVLVPEDIPTNRLLAATDVLVSDYSSIAVDFLATGRPVVFAGLDGDDYAATRGLYVDPASFPGPRCTDLPSLAAAVTRGVQHGIDPEFADRYSAMAEAMVHLDDGRASARVLDVVFRGVGEDTWPRLDEQPHRPSMLIHLGGMRANGITSAAVNLLPALVDAGVDVSVTFPRSDTSVARASRARVDPRVRQLPRMGGMNGSKVVQLQRRLADRRSDPLRHHEHPELSAAYDAEWHRCFGDARFDAVVDFSGYSPFWAALMLHAPKPVVRSIWMHNDMAAEVERLVNGKPSMRRSLRAVIGMYDQYERIVAVSESLRDHNATALADVAHGPFLAARNLVDDRPILAGAAVPPERVLRERHEARRLDPPEPFERPVWLDDLADPRLTWFACVGRLSPEKNHARLLDAFATVHRDRPDTRLLIVGDGYLRPTLEQQAARLSIADAVAFTGAVGNPYAFMAAADCVVLSSDHEGQPMVILEAAVLHRAIVSTRFASAAHALPGDMVHLVERSADGVADGMRAFLRGEVAAASLDVPAYDAEALDEFLRATLPEGTPHSGDSWPQPERLGA